VNKDLQMQLLALKQNDDDTRARLVAAGVLYQGYNKEMETVHVHNAEQLEAIIHRVGWPGVPLVGEEGAQAAFIIVHHAISRPGFQRKCLELIREAVRSGDVDARHEALLVDRIRFNERRPQMYGTIFDWDENGEMSPWHIEYPETVDARRADVGLMSLADQIQKVRESSRREGAVAPADYFARQTEIEEWSRAAGWL
jgi:hypothetical protein